MSLDILPMILMALAAGAGLGAIYVVLLRVSVRLLLTDTWTFVAIALSLGRLVVVGAGFWAAAQFGGAALMATLAGFMLVRMIATRLAGSPSWT